MAAEQQVRLGADGAGARAASAISAAFQRGRPALIVYLMAGYPDPPTSLTSLVAAAEGGADLIELGVPYGDPVADGPVIADAARVACAREGGFGLTETIDLAAKLRSALGAGAPPIVLMTYLNPLMRLGLAAAAERMRGAGIAGVIVPDMPVEAARPWLAASHGLDTVFLAAPTSTPERLQALAKASSGFVYCVSTLGVTGERDRLADGVRELVARLRAVTDLPVAVGFGISTPSQAAEVADLADGVIVGSAVVRRQADPEAVHAFVTALAEAVHGSGSALPSAPQAP
ncbi:MAG: tryptophan synthase subunit alpha [Coriobacteriia bacterium]|nr:tryptophan synthase subunit alpha [Coriobacteriia bacterium]